MAMLGALVQDFVKLLFGILVIKIAVFFFKGFFVSLENTKMINRQVVIDENVTGHYAIPNTIGRKLLYFIFTVISFSAVVMITYKIWNIFGLIYLLMIGIFVIRYWLERNNGWSLAQFIFILVTVVVVSSVIQSAGNQEVPQNNVIQELTVEQANMEWEDIPYEICLAEESLTKV